MYFSQEPISNPVLAEALGRMKKEPTAEARSSLFQEIVLRAKFILPVMLSNSIVTDGQGRPTIPAGTTARAALLTGEDDRHYFPAFTSQAEWEKWQASGRQQMAVAEFDDYAALLDQDTKAAGLVVDPFGDSLMLSREDVTRLKKRKDGLSVPATVQKVDAGVKLTLQAVSKDASELVHAMTAYLKTCPQVKSAYLCMMRREGKESFLVVLHPALISRSVSDGLAKAALPYLCGKPLNVAPALSELGERVRMSYAPFYSSKA